MSVPRAIWTGRPELYAGCYRRLVGALTLVAGSRAEAEEVVQESFVRLVPRWGTVSGYDDPEAWVRTVALRLLSNRWRHSRVARLGLARMVRDEALPAVGGEAVDVERGLASLPLAQRQVVVLHYLLDVSVAEVAAELGVPVGTVKSRLARARTALAPLLREERFDHA